jgi:hypothetical protein
MADRRILAEHVSLSDTDEGGSTMKVNGLLPTTLALVACLWSPATAQLERAEYAIEGTWTVQVTPYNCITGVPFPSFYGIASFDRGGTATVINSGQTAPAPTTAAVGRWVSGGGRNYTLTTITFVLFGQAVQPWAQRNTMTITLDDPDKFTGETRVDFHVVPGTLPPPTVPLPPNACAKTTATRYP